MFIEIPVVLAREKSSILLLDKEERGSLERLGLVNFARLKVFINELSAHVHLLWDHRIGFGYLWDEGFF